MDGETEAEVVALEIDPALDRAQAFAESQRLERSRSAPVVVGREPLAPPHVGIYAKEDALLQFLGQDKIDSRVDGVAGRHEQQRLSARLEDARYGFERLARVKHVLQERLADHQVGISSAAVIDNVGADGAVVAAWRGRRQFPGINIQPDDFQAKLGLALRVDEGILAAAHVIDDGAGKGVLGDDIIDEVGVSVDEVLAGQELVEFPGEADLARDQLADYRADAPRPRTG